MALEKFPDQSECPLCMEPLEMDDINFYPCTCGYQICRFCWHRIRTNENGLCPACRKQYPEDPAEYKPLTAEELQKIKNEKRQKDIQKKQKVSESRKLLSQVRVVQKNLVFIVGLTQKLADPEVLKKHEYFGRFGKIHKIVINTSTTYAGSGGPTASAYITYVKMEDALRAIQYITQHNIMDGRIIKSSLGTTKYCSHFLKGSSCPKTDCMYLHEMGEEGASFTKEEMQAGRHQEYEIRLLEQTLCTNPTPSSTTTTTPCTTLNQSSTLTNPQHQASQHPSYNNYPCQQATTTITHYPNKNPASEGPPCPDPLLSTSPFPNDLFKTSYPSLLPDNGPFIENNNTRYYYTNNVDLLDNVSPPSSSPPPTTQGTAILNFPDNPLNNQVELAPCTSPPYNSFGNGSSALGDTNGEQTYNPVTSTVPRPIQNGHLSDGNSNAIHPKHARTSKSKPDPIMPVDEDKTASQEAMLKISQSLSLQMELIFKKKMAAAAAAAEHPNESQSQSLAGAMVPPLDLYQEHHQQPPHHDSAPFGAQDEPPYVSTARRPGHTRHLSGPGMCEGRSYDPQQPQHTYRGSHDSSHFLSQYLPQDYNRADTNQGLKEISGESVTDTAPDDILNYINITDSIYPDKLSGGNGYDKNLEATEEATSQRCKTESSGTGSHHRIDHHGENPINGGITKPPQQQQQQRYQILLRDGQRKVLSADLSSGADSNFADQDHRPVARALAPTEVKPHSLRALSAEKLCSHLDQPSLLLYDHQSLTTTYPPQQQHTKQRAIAEGGTEDNSSTKDALLQSVQSGEMNGDKGRGDSDTNLANATFPDWQEAFGFGPSQKHIEDDLGFDPYNESTKALAELIQQEQRPQHEPRNHTNCNNNAAHHSATLMQIPGNAQRFQEVTTSPYKTGTLADNPYKHLTSPNGHPLKAGDEGVNNYAFSSSPLKSTPFLPHFDPSLSQYPLGAAPPTPLNSSYDEGVGGSSNFDSDGKNPVYPPSLNNPYHQNQHHPGAGSGNDKRFSTMPGGAPLLGPPAAAMMLNFLSSASSGVPLSGGAPASTNRHHSHSNAPFTDRNPSNFDSNGSNNTTEYAMNVMPSNNPLDEASSSSDKNGSLFNTALLSNLIQQYIMTNGGNNPPLPTAQHNNFIGGMATMSQAQILARLQQMMALSSLTSHDQMGQSNNSGGAVTSFCNLLNALTLGINNGLPFQHMFNAAAYNPAASNATNNNLPPNSTHSNLNTGAPNLRTLAGVQMGPRGLFPNQNSFTPLHPPPSSSSKKLNQFGLNFASNIQAPLVGPTTTPSPFGVKDVADALKAMSVCHASLNPAMSPANNNFIQSPSPFINFASMSGATAPALNGFRIPAIPPFNAASFLNQQQQNQQYQGDIGNSHGGNSQLYKKGVGQGFEKCSSTTPPAFMDSLVSATPPSPHSLFLRSMLSPPFNQLLSAAAGMSPLKLFQHPSQFPLAISSNQYNYPQNQSYGNEHGNQQQQQQFSGGSQGNNCNGLQQFENNHLTLDGYNTNKSMILSNAPYSNGPLMDQLHMHVSPIVMASQGNHSQNHSQQPPMPQMDMTNFQAAHPPPVYLNSSTTSPSSNPAVASDANYHGRGEGPYNVPVHDAHSNASGPGYNNCLKGGGVSSYHHQHHPYMGDHLANTYNANNNTHNMIMGAGGHGATDLLGGGPNSASTYNPSNPISYGGPLANDFSTLHGSGPLYPDPCLSMWSSVNGLGRVGSGSECGNGAALNSGSLSSDNLEGN